MKIQDVEELLDRKLDEKLDQKLEYQRKEYERFTGALLEQVCSENKMSFEVLNGRIDGLEEKVDSIQEMVVQNTEDIAEIRCRVV